MPDPGERMIDSPIKVVVLLGTRPEAIKMAPVIALLRARPAQFEPTVCATGQHRELLVQTLETFGLSPDIDLDLMQPDQTPIAFLSRALPAIDEALRRLEPDWVLVQGDTTTAMAGSLAAYHRRVRLGHVEAGLRTGDLRNPFPEEANRRIADLLADALFAPTAGARSSLLAEGVEDGRIFVTGNTVVDALLEVARRVPEHGEPADVLITAHRRESFGAPFAEILAAVKELAQGFPALRFVFPLHPNPSVRGPACAALAGVENIALRAPLDYIELVRVLRSAKLVLTDSGGIQEEAPTFGVPVLVLRNETERPEGVARGVARLVGTARQSIVDGAATLLTDAAAHRRMARAGNPYGDGCAASRIVAILAGERPAPFSPSDASDHGW
jgi:UDP-N-acetylglucosamine 2-epimerase (non-hydrolysing)